MKAAIIIGGTGAILVLTSIDSFENNDFVEALREKGITKYIAFEVPVDLVKSRYGQLYQTTMADRKQTDLMRVLDVDGQRIFTQFNLRDFGRPVCHEPYLERKAA